jgi:hypothetical protein
MKQFKRTEPLFWLEYLPSVFCHCVPPARMCHLRIVCILLDVGAQVTAIPLWDHSLLYCWLSCSGGMSSACCSGHLQYNVTLA